MDAKAVTLEKNICCTHVIVSLLKAWKVTITPNSHVPFMATFTHLIVDNNVLDLH